MIRPLILLADDDELLRAIVEHKLDRAGYDVKSVEDGCAVVPALEAHAPAALILDAMMPVIDGFEVLRRLRTDARFAALPIIMLSALKREEDIVEALKIGATDYLVKPFNPDELVLRLSPSSGHGRSRDDPVGRVILTLAPPAQVQPASDAQSYEDAVANRLAGRPAEAAQALSVIVQNNPANADAWLNLGLADFALGRNDAAEAALQTTLRIAPEYADAGIALARVALTKGDIPAARTRLQAVLAHDPNNQEAKELARTLSADAAPARLEAPSAPRWRADAVAGYSRLSGRAPWREYDVAIGGRVNDRDNAVIGIERSSRFGLNDTFASLRIDHGFSSGWSVYGALAGAPGSHFRPREQVQAGFSSAALHLTQDGRWAVNGGLDVTAARYPVGGVTTVSPFASLQAPKGVTLLVQVIVSGVEHAGTLSGYHVAADWAATRKLSLAVGYTDAPESDTGRTMPVKAESAAVGWSFTDTFALRLIGVHETRPGLKRDEIDLAVTRRF